MIKRSWKVNDASWNTFMEGQMFDSLLSDQSTSQKEEVFNALAQSRYPEASHLRGVTESMLRLWKEENKRYIKCHRCLV